jgi:hypothetical protein
MTRITALLVWLVLVSCASAEVKIYPPTDQAIGAVTSDTVGRWIVFRAAPFGVVPSQPITLGGDPGCLWTGSAGTYTAVLIPNDVSVGYETGTVVLGGSPEPDPDPDPDPDVEVDTVVVISEQTDQTAYREVSIRMLREWVIEQGHGYRLYDPDQAAASPYLEEATRVGLPAIIVLSGDDVVVAKQFPASGNTVTTGKAAGEAAVTIVKEAGG